MSVSVCVCVNVHLKRKGSIENKDTMSEKKQGARERDRERKQYIRSQPCLCLRRVTSVTCNTFKNAQVPSVPSTAPPTTAAAAAHTPSASSRPFVLSLSPSYDEATVEGRQTG